MSYSNTTLPPKRHRRSRKRSLSSGLTTVFCGLLFVLPAFAADSIERKSNSTPVSGEITNITRNEITLTAGSLKKTITVPSNDVASVRWNDEPAKLNLLRGDERAGRLQKAADGFLEVLKELPGGQKNLRADVEFLAARATAKLALADASRIKDAVSRLDEFVRSNSSSFRYYEAVELLGSLYAAQKDVAKANATYALLKNAPWPEYKLGAQLAEARVLLNSGNSDGALALYNQIAAVEATEPAAQSRRFEALIGKAVCLAKKGEHVQATEALDQVIKDVPAEATAIQAEAYLRQGDSLLAAGKNKAALHAFLHVDLLFSKEQAFHAEALYRLTQLWTVVGHPERAADASARLRNQYPESQWVKQLTGPTDR